MREKGSPIVLQKDPKPMCIGAVREMFLDAGRMGRPSYLPDSVLNFHMNMILEVDWVQMNETKGTGIFVEDGIYFQPYGSNSSNFPWGDSLAIQATGAMGALHLHKKLSEKEDPLVIARERRNSIVLNELVKNNEAAYFEWGHIANVKKELAHEDCHDQYE